MTIHHFTLMVDGPDLQSDTLIDALFEAGCDDAAIGRVEGIQFVDFDREAASLDRAILSAVGDLERIDGVEVVRIADAGLVPMAEIATRIGRTREGVRLLVTGARGPGGFPPPITDPHSRNRLWRWSDVEAWLAKHIGETLPDEDDYVNAPMLPQPVGRQREVLYLPAHGHTVVLGTAGSGKTTLAILRSLYLADPNTEHGGRTLLVTFNRCLVTYMRHLAGAIGGSVAVENYHRFARGYLSARGRLANRSISSPDDRARFIRHAIHEARSAGDRHVTLERPVEFFDEEFEWIQHHGIGDEQEYVDAERIGRVAARVIRAERPAVFSLYSRYLEQRRHGGKSYDWSDLASSVLGELRTDRQDRRYRHVVIDEGQDFSPEMLRSLAAAIPAGGSLTFFGDIAQQIYGHRMSWRSAGLAVREVWRFQENYRNTRQISQLALALAAMPSFPDDPDLVEPTAPTADGPPPALVRRSSEDDERRLIVSRAPALARTGTVAILVRTRDQEKAIPQPIRSQATRLHRDLQRWPANPGLFYGTYHAAKGLEFDTVFLPFLSGERWPYPPDVQHLGAEEATVRNARLLYVGITRARSTLVMTYSGRVTPLLPADEALYQP